MERPNHRSCGPTAARTWLTTWKWRTTQIPTPIAISRPVVTAAEGTGWPLACRHARLESGTARTAAAPARTRSTRSTAQQQRLLKRARWDTDGVAASLRNFVVEHLAEPRRHPSDGGGRRGQRRRVRPLLPGTSETLQSGHSDLEATG